jgi:hypothetical protein
VTPASRTPPPTGADLYREALSPVGTDGLVAATARVWDRFGALLASGDQTMLCRPAANAGPPAAPAATGS